MVEIDYISYDEEADAAYISFTSEKNENITTLPLEGRSILLDFDANDQLVGIESINASNDLPQQLLDNAQNLESDSSSLSDLNNESLDS